MVDLACDWSSSFAKHAQQSLLVELPHEFTRVLASTSNASDFIMRVQNGLHRSSPEIAATFTQIERILTQMGQISFVEIVQQSSGGVSPTLKKKTAGYKIESTLQVCQLLVNYFAAQKRQAQAKVAAGAADNASGTGTSNDDSASVNIIMKPWLDIDTGCEFRIFIIGVHIHGTFLHFRHLF